MHRLISTWLWMDHLETYTLPLITVFSSHLEGSILCKAIRSSAGVRGDMWVRPSECVPSNLRMKKDKRLKPNSCNWTQHTQYTSKSMRYLALVSFPNCWISWKCQIILTYEVTTDKSIEEESLRNWNSAAKKFPAYLWKQSFIILLTRICYWILSYVSSSLFIQEYTDLIAL